VNELRAIKLISQHKEKRKLFIYQRITIKLRIAINNLPEKFAKAAMHMPEAAKKLQKKYRLAMRNMHFI